MSVVRRLGPVLSLVLLVGTGSSPALVVTELLGPAGTGGFDSFACETPSYVGRCSLALDSVGNAYVTSAGTNRVFKIEPDGTATVFLAPGMGGATLTGPRSVVVDAADNVFVGCDGISNVVKRTPAGVVTELIDGSGDGAGHPLFQAAELAVDSAGNLFVAGEFSDNVFKVTPGGIITQVLDAGGVGSARELVQPYNLGIDAGDNLFVLGRDSWNVVRLAPDGTGGEVLDRRGDGLGNRFVCPGGNNCDLHVEPDGTVYVGSTGYFSNASTHVFRVDPDGTVRVIADGTGDGHGNALAAVGSVTTDPDGNVYATNFVVRPDGRTSMLFPNSGPGSLTAYVEAAPDAAGPIYAVSHSARRVLKIEYECGDGLIAPLEECDDGNTVSGDCCSSTCTLEVACPACETCDPGTGACVQAPRPSCRQSTQVGKSKLLLKAAGDKAVWKWTRGEQTSHLAFGDPLAGDDYALCLYETGGGSPGLVLQADAPAGGVCGTRDCWKQIGWRGYKYVDGDRTPTGVQKLLLRPGDEGKAKVVFKADGANLSLPALPLDLPVVAQVQGANGQCWEAAYFESGVRANDAGKFAARDGSPSGAFLDTATR